MPALEKALSEDPINYGFMVKDPSWFYPIDISDDIDNFENTHYDDYPMLEKVAYYFDAMSHNFPEIDGVEIHQYRSNIIKEIPILKEKYGIE